MLQITCVTRNLSHGGDIVKSGEAGARRRKRQQARAAVRLAIEETLDRLPEAYSPALYRQKCEAVYLHVYDSHFGAGRSIYAMAA